MFFIDEFDRDDRFGRVVRDGLADAGDLLLASDSQHSTGRDCNVRGICALPDCLAHEPEGQVCRQRSHLAVGRRRAHGVEE